MQITEAASALLKQLSTSEEFSEGAKKIASFFHALEERHTPASLLMPLLDLKFSSSKMVEYLLFCILDTSVSDFDLMKSLQHLRRLERLLGKHAYHLQQLSTTEQCLLKKLQEKSPVKDIYTLQIAKNVMDGWMQQFINRVDPGKLRRKQMSTLYVCEAEALRARSDWLSENVDTYDMKKMIRMLPLISTCDEYAKAIIDLADLIEKGRMPGSPVLSLEMSMKTDSFEKWFKHIAKQPELAFLHSVITTQRKKLIPGRHLAAVTTIGRAVLKDDPNPLSWIALAVEHSTKEGFSIDAGESLPTLKKFLNNSGAEIKGNTIEGDFLKNSFSQLVGDDHCTRDIKAPEEMTAREMVNRCMRNDSLLARLLDSPKVYNSPGLVERIAHSSHSHFILQKIAITRELYTGQANAGVPLALLKNTTNIPISQLRQFVNPRYVSLIEMKELLKFPFSIRREVFSEVQSFLDRKR
jgi:hypothetical protein